MSVEETVGGEATEVRVERTVGEEATEVRVERTVGEEATEVLNGGTTGNTTVAVSVEAITGGSFEGTAGDEATGITIDKSVGKDATDTNIKSSDEEEAAGANIEGSGGEEAAVKSVEDEIDDPEVNTETDDDQENVERFGRSFEEEILDMNDTTTETEVSQANKAAIGVHTVMAPGTETLGIHKETNDDKEAIGMSMEASTNKEIPEEIIELNVDKENVNLSRKVSTEKVTGVDIELTTGKKIPDGNIENIGGNVTLGGPVEKTDIYGEQIRNTKGTSELNVDTEKENSRCNVEATKETSEVRKETPREIIETMAEKRTPTRITDGKGTSEIDSEQVNSSWNIEASDEREAEGVLEKTDEKETGARKESSCGDETAEDNVEDNSETGWRAVGENIQTDPEHILEEHFEVSLTTDYSNVGYEHEIEDPGARGDSVLGNLKNDSQKQGASLDDKEFPEENLKGETRVKTAAIFSGRHAVFPKSLVQHDVPRQELKNRRSSLGEALFLFDLWTSLDIFRSALSSQCCGYRLYLKCILWSIA